MESEKKKRCANFTNSERQRLLRITNKYKNILENKKTDGVTWREKEDIWNKIELIWNSSSTGLPRSAKQLKDKYNGIKKEIKKRYSQHNSYVTGTGGGKYVPPPEPSTEEEKELAETIILSTKGLQSSVDCDAMAGISGVQFTVTSTDNDNIIEEEIETNWGQYSAKMYQTPIHPCLSDPSMEETRQDFDTSALNTVYEEYNNNKENIDESNIPSTNEHNYDRQEPQKEAWVNRRRPALKKRKSMSSASAKFEALAEKKSALVELEKSIAEEKLHHNRIEHERRIQILDLQKQEYELRIQLLKYQIENKKSNFPE